MTNELAKPIDNDRIRTIVWRNTHKSVRELAEMTGLTVQQTLAVRNEMLDGVDALTVDQEKTKLLVDLHELAERAKEEFESTSDARSKAPLISASISAIKLLLSELRQIEKSSNGEVTALNALRQRELVSLVTETVNRSVAEIAVDNDIDQKYLFEVFNRNLEESASDMDARNSGTE